jgi:hypothetical protein
VAEAVNDPLRIPFDQRPVNPDIDLIRRIRSSCGAGLVNYFGPSHCRPAALWHYIQPDVTAVRSILLQITLPDDHPVIMYTEDPYPGHVERMPFRKARECLLGIPEFSFRPCYYVLPEDLSWIIAHTDDDVKEGHLMIIKGPVLTRSE